MYSVYPKFSSVYSESWWSRVIRLQSAKTWHVWLYSICSSVVFQLFLSLPSFSHWNLLERFFSPLLPKNAAQCVWSDLIFNIRWTYSALPGIVIIQTRSNIDCVSIPPFPGYKFLFLFYNSQDHLGKCVWWILNVLQTKWTSLVHPCSVLSPASSFESRRSTSTKKSTWLRPEPSAGGGH